MAIWGDGDLVGDRVNSSASSFMKASSRWLIMEIVPIQPLIEREPYYACISAFANISA
jgi:hypothetical protein